MYKVPDIITCEIGEIGQSGKIGKNKSYVLTVLADFTVLADLAVFHYQYNLRAMGNLRPLPKAFDVTLIPGGA